MLNSRVPWTMRGVVFLTELEWMAGLATFLRGRTRSFVPEILYAASQRIRPRAIFLFFYLSLPESGEFCPTSPLSRLQWNLPVLLYTATALNYAELYWTALHTNRRRFYVLHIAVALEKLAFQKLRLVSFQILKKFKVKKLSSVAASIL